MKFPHNSGDARVIPIILRPCDWQNSQLGKLQALPKDAKPITKWDDKDDAFTDVVRGIRGAINQIIKSQATSAESLKPLSSMRARNIETVNERLKLEHQIQNNDWRTYTEFINDTNGTQNALSASLPVPSNHTRRAGSVGCWGTSIQFSSLMERLVNCTL